MDKENGQNRRQNFQSNDEAVTAVGQFQNYDQALRQQHPMAQFSGSSPS